MTPGGPALEVRGLTVHFGERVALHHVDVTADAGELLALTGPNGSGKTTLLRSALGLVPVADGAVRLFGRASASMTVRERARSMAWVPQEEAPTDNVRVLDYVLYGRYARLRPFEGEGEVDRHVARRALSDVGLADRANSGILELSGGERQRLLLARGLAQEAPVLLLDEPTAHLDIGFQLDMLDRVRRLVRERGVCAIAALHDLNLASRFADRLAVLSHGRLVADGPPEATLTPALLRSVWGVDAERRRDARTGTTYLVPFRTAAEPVPPAPSSRGRLHVIGGGGAAAPILRALVDDGWSVSAGVIPLLDTDAETADELGVPFVAEIPFAPISEESRAALRHQLDGVRAIAVAPVPVGPSNVANFEELRGRSPGTLILLVETTPFGGRDFTRGRAAELRDALISQGAEVVPDIAALRKRLDVLASTSPSG